MDLLLNIKNIFLVFAIVFALPILMHLYINYFYPFEDYKETEEISKLQNKIVQLEEQEKLDFISFQQNKIERNKIEKLQNEIKNLKDKIQQKKDDSRNQYNDRYNDYKTNIFIIIMLIAFFSILIGTLIKYHLLKVAFTLGSLILILYGLFYAWFGVSILIKIIAGTIWFLILISLLVYYNKNEIIR